jgi:hypothetical protein
VAWTWCPLRPAIAESWVPIADVAATGLQKDRQLGRSEESWKAVLKLGLNASHLLDELHIVRQQG